MKLNDIEGSVDFVIGPTALQAFGEIVIRIECERMLLIPTRKAVLVNFYDYA